MAYFIFLKYLRRIEEFRKNPHVKIPPKSPCENFQSLGIFKNQILFGKEFFRRFRPSRGPSSFLFHWPSPPPLPTRPRPLGWPILPSRPSRPCASGAVSDCRLPHGKTLPSAPPLPSPRPADKWAPPIIPHLQFCLSSAASPPPPTTPRTTQPHTSGCRPSRYSPTITPPPH
jgi:hypothetical protein